MRSNNINLTQGKTAQDCLHDPQLMLAFESYPFLDSLGKGPLIWKYVIFPI